MSSNALGQVELVLGDAVIDYTAGLKSRLEAVYSNHSAHGRLHSGATVRAAVGAMDQIASAAVEQMSTKVLEIARDPEAYSAFRNAMSNLIQSFRHEMPRAIGMASGRMPNQPNPSIERASYDLFEQMESKINRKVEIAGFGFGNPSEATVVPLPTLANKKTGRPRGAFWDDMWAAIASDLYGGRLEPRNQADLEQAMLKWIEENGHSAAVSTVRGRARRLWDRIQISE